MRRAPPLETTSKIKGREGARKRSISKLDRAASAKLSANVRQQRRTRIESGALLAGLIFDDRGSRMTPTYSMRRGDRYRYYVSRAFGVGTWPRQTETMMAPLRRSSAFRCQLPAPARERQSSFQAMQDQGLAALIRRSFSPSREQDRGCVHYDVANTAIPSKLRDASV